MWKKIILSVFAILVLITIGSYFFLPKYATQKFYHVLEKADSVSFKNLKIDFWNGNLSVDSLYLSDTAGYIFGTPLHAEISEIDILHIKTRQLILTKTLHIDSVTIKWGVVKAIFSSQSDSTKSPKKAKRNPLKSIEIVRTHLDSLAFDFLFHPTDTSNHIKGIFNGHALGFYFPFSNPDEIDADAVKFKINHFYAQNNDGISYYHIDEIGLNEAENKIYIQNIHIGQRLKTYEYARHFGFDKLHYEIEVDSIVLRKIAPIKSLLKNVHIPEVDVYSPNARLFKDKRFYHKTHRRKFPFEAIAEIPLPIDIDTININNGQLYFKALTRDDGKTAKMQLTSLNAQICNVSSNKNSTQDHWTKVIGHIVFYNKMHFDFTWKFDKRKQGKSFLFDGTFGRAPLSSFNPFIENRLDMRFKSGQVLGGRMLAEGNTISGEGKLDFYYKDMKVELLKKQDHQSDFGLTLMGGATNFIIRNNNLPNKNPKQGIIYAEPQQDKFVIAFLWRLLQSGITDIMAPTTNAKNAEERRNEYLK